jgi:hypothetical protein
MSAPGQGLDGLVVGIVNRACALFKWPIVVLGLGPNGQPLPVQVDASGNVIVSGGAGSGTTFATTFLTATGNGSIPIGVKKYSFAVLGGTVTLGGQPVPVGATINGGGYGIPSSAAIGYTISGGSVLIQYEI